MVSKWKIDWYNKKERQKRLDKCDKGFHEIPNMSVVEGNKEIKERKGLKVVTPNKLLTRFPILIAPIKSGNNSYK